MINDRTDNLATQSAGAQTANRPESTVLAATIPPNIAADTATASPPLASNSANKKRAVWREKRIARLITLAAQKGSINNRDVRLALRVKQSTATEYLHELVNRGKLQMEGKGKATRYRI